MRHDGGLGQGSYEYGAEKCLDLGYLLKTERMRLADRLDMVVIVRDLSWVPKCFIWPTKCMIPSIENRYNGKTRLKEESRTYK